MEHLKTGMYVEVDGVTVSYGKVLNQFCPAGWYGIIYYIQTSWQEGQEKHAAIVEKMVRQFEEQSYDHGSEWVEQRREIIQQDKMSQTSIVSFRIRDIH